MHVTTAVKLTVFSEYNFQMYYTHFHQYRYIYWASPFVMGLLVLTCMSKLAYAVRRRTFAFGATLAWRRVSKKHIAFAYHTRSNHGASMLSRSKTSHHHHIPPPQQLLSSRTIKYKIIHSCHSDQPALLYNNIPILGLTDSDETVYFVCTLHTITLHPGHVEVLVRRNGTILAGLAGEWRVIMRFVCFIQLFKNISFSHIHAPWSPIQCLFW